MKPDLELLRKISLEALFDYSPNALVSIDANYRIVDINQAFIDLFGYKLEEIKGKHVDDVMNMGREGSANAELTAMIQRGEHIDEEGIRYNKQGQPIEMIIKGFPVIFEGKMVGAFGIYIDITKHKKNEALIRESEARNRAILNAIPDLIFIFDRKGTYLDCHASDQNLLAADPSVLLGSTVHDILPADISEKTMLCFDKLYKTGQTQVMEYNLDLPDGLHYFEARLTIMDEERILTVVRDITNRIRAEEKIRIEQERLQNIIEGSGVGTWEWNTQSGETIYNENWARMLGYTLDELNPKSQEVWKSMAHPDDLKKSDENAERHLRGELPYYECECRVKHKNGHWVWILDRGKILTRSPDGRPLSMFGTHTDITERKKAEENIRYISLHDSLTGLYNRNYLDEEMKRLDTKRQLPLSLIMADLNGLKLINDTYGHPVGDEALKSAAAVLKKSCREEDIIARWGGDEFVILLPGTAALNARRLCKRIIENCKEEFINEVPISIALGVGEKKDHTTDLSDALRTAEDEMYRQKLLESRSAKSAVLRALLKTLEAKSFESEKHAHNMQEVARKVGHELKLPDAELNRLNLLITLHDIGKINLDQDLLTKNGKLSGEEWEVIKAHTEIGFRIARSTEEFAHVAEDILGHHERWDGSGYPQGLKGEQIPLLARIVAIVDAYEVMKNGRPYKKAMSDLEIAAEFRKCSGNHFDPALVEIILTILETKE